jgi:hypothetical protein
MLTTVLSRLQSLISSRFTAASFFFPTLAFWFAHALVLFEVNARFRVFARSVLGESVTTSAVLLTAGLIGVAMSAYVLSAVLPAIQSIMEGNWPTWLVSLFAPAQMRRFERLESELAANNRLRGRLANPGNAPGGKTAAEAWQAALTRARQVGALSGVNNFRRTAPSAQKVERLANLRRRSRPITADDLSAAVTDLTFNLRANNADLPGPDSDRALEETRQLLWDLIDYGDQFAVGQYRLLSNKRQFIFGALPLAPTHMGNVARTIQTYAVERYDFNFDLFWSRMQRLLQKDKDFGPLLQDSKDQLDFLVACSFLSLVWSVIWAPWLLFSSGPRGLFLMVALVGPLCAWAWYRAASAHYRTFADVLRTAIDLFRFALLPELHIPLPDSVVEERELWQTLDGLQSLYELRDMRYAHPKSP